MGSLKTTFFTFGFFLCLFLLVRSQKGFRLLFPRYVFPFGPNSILSMESNEGYVYRYTDTDGDGKSWTKVAQAKGIPGLNTVAWKPTGKSLFLKIEADSQGDHAWSMKKLTLLSR